MIKFFWNGIKDSEANEGKLQKVFYSDGEFVNLPAGTITIYARDYRRLSNGIREMFRVINESDIMTDYFENDTIRVDPSHILYPQVKAALDAQKAHAKKIQERKAA